MNKNKISVLGGGSWGTVLAYLASLNGNEVTLWMRDEEAAKEINDTNINSRYLPNLTLGSNLTATSEMADISDSGTIIFCIPSDAFREVSDLASSYIKEESFLVTASCIFSILKSFSFMLSNDFSRFSARFWERVVKFPILFIRS